MTPPSTTVLLEFFRAGDRESVWAAIRESFIGEMLYPNQSDKDFIRESFQLLNPQVAVVVTTPTYHALVQLGLKVFRENAALPAWLVSVICTLT